jgi:two-component system, NtrC family, nitrogen regulation sensor histidine kinase NtrY
MAWVEVLTVLALLAIVAVSAFIVTDQRPESLLTPPMVAALLVANLVPAMALMVLAARRVAMRRAARSPIGGRGRLHVRLVALFSVVATVPTLLVVIFASLLFQSGLQFWFSDNAVTVLRNAQNVAQVYRDENIARIGLEAQAMGEDVVRAINAVGVDSQAFRDEVLIQKVYRTLSEAAVISITPAGIPRSHVVIDLDRRPIEDRVSATALRQLRAGEALIATDAGDRVEAVVRLDPTAEVYLYVSRYVNADVLRQIDEASRAASSYQEALNRARSLQFRFHAVLFGVSLLIVAIAIWIALTLADRLVRPVAQLVDAAGKVAAGDLSVRVTVPQERDEVGALGSAFNRMTTRLEEQTGALVAANAQLDSRRAFTEAVLSGVTAGVMSVDGDRVVRLINSSAEALLKTKSPVGRKLSDLAPELDRQLSSAEREDVVQLTSGGEPRTLAVKTVKVRGGHVLTFDDITEQLMDQRRAAWSDVARRIAHEIKNPLTPIQLAAERLQRRYGKEIASDPGTFERLTGTIVRQVGDLRRMVDEFSSFARMPKPTFREEPLGEIARQALFLHEVAHPDIAFSLDVPEPSPLLVCDRRLLGQALTNIVKNGVEAIEQKRSEPRARSSGEAGDRVAMSIRPDGGRIVIEIADTGIGLPAERGRLTEPYMTTRAKGTGLGLAIVKKIVEEHFGQIEFEDVPEGGSRVRLVFDPAVLEQLSGTSIPTEEDSATH